MEATCDGHARLLAVEVGVGWPPSLQLQVLAWLCLILRSIKSISSGLFF